MSVSGPAGSEAQGERAHHAPGGVARSHDLATRRDRWLVTTP